MLTKYFKKVFANTGDKTELPREGSFSFNSGFTQAYERTPDEPNRLGIPRLTLNWLLFRITTAIKEYQEQGFPDYITNANNDNTLYSYSYGSAVYYNNNLWVSRGNTTIPPAVSNEWDTLDFNSGANTELYEPQNTTAEDVAGKTPYVGATGGPLFVTERATGTGSENNSNWRLWSDGFKEVEDIVVVTTAERNALNYTKTLPVTFTDTNYHAGYVVGTTHDTSNPANNNKPASGTAAPVSTTTANHYGRQYNPEFNLTCRGIGIVENGITKIGSHAGVFSVRVRGF